MTTKESNQPGGDNQNEKTVQQAVQQAVQPAQVDSLISSVLTMVRKTMHDSRRPAGYFPEIRNKITKLTPS